MKNYLILLILLIFTLFVPNKAQAALVTGDMLKSHCSSEKSEDLLICTNYIAGIIDYHLFMKTMNVLPDLGFCLPKDISIEEASFVIMKYLQNSPYYDPFIGASSVIMALHNEYPCAVKKGAAKGR